MPNLPCTGSGPRNRYQNSTKLHVPEILRQSEVRARKLDDELQIYQREKADGGKVAIQTLPEEI